MLRSPIITDLTVPYSYLYATAGGGILPVFYSATSKQKIDTFSDSTTTLTIPHRNTLSITQEGNLILDISAQNINDGTTALKLSQKMYQRFFNSAQSYSPCGVIEAPSKLEITSGADMILTPNTKNYGSKGYLMGTWYKDAAEITTSSRNKKHDIEELDDRYSILLDNLKPVRFKYNDGVSNRYHTGLILDEMKDAMDTAHIDSSELAAYCVQDKRTGDGGIRYEELVALLIKEVQELKTQVNVLTEKLNKLEEK